MRRVRNGTVGIGLGAGGIDMKKNVDHPRFPTSRINNNLSCLCHVTLNHKQL